MHLVAIFDFIFFLASMAAIAFLLKGWNHPFNRSTKLVLLGLLIFSLVYSILLALEWSGITGRMEVLEDFTGALLPMWWAFAFYALAQEVAGRDLAESESKYRTLVEQIPLATYRTSANGVNSVLYISPQIETILGFPAGQWLKQPDLWARQVHPDELQRVLNQLNASHNTGEKFVSEYRMFTKDRKIIWVHDESIEVKDGSGKPLFIQGIIGDITERKEAEEALSQYSKHLEKLVAERTETLAQVNRELTKENAGRKHLERKLIYISEAEKRRIGQDLHDSVGQQLTGLSLMAKKLEHVLLEKRSDEAAIVSEIVKLLADSTEEVRNMAKGLHPVNMDAANLASAIEKLAAHTESTFSARCAFKCVGAIQTRDTSMAVHLYRIVQESISNAIKHGKAKNINIELVCNGDNSSLTITNDGLDFPEDIDTAGGMGLRLMEYRCEEIGGSIDIRRNPEGGTKVTCLFSCYCKRPEG